MIRTVAIALMLILPSTSAAAVYISEVAWPHPYVAIVLFLGFSFYLLLLLRRTGVWQRKGLGKMGTLMLGLCLTPQVSIAAVYISEVAWMGTSVSANDEWIELYNDGGATSLDGWRITDGVNFDVTLEGAGSVAAGAFAVLERTDDSSALGSAFYIYTGSLPNTGATLRLYNTAGNLVDQVAGGENWENIGGDNTTKETAQYTTSGWITASPTPGAQNATTGSSKPSEEVTTKSTTQSTSGGSGAPARRTTSTLVQDIPLNVELTAPTTGFVGQPVTFSVNKAAFKTGRTISWNFGDTNTSEGSEVTHTYAFAGTYIVHVSGRTVDEQLSVQHEITILPVSLEITRNRAGVVQISNTAPYDTALGGYVVAGPNAEFTIPPHTYLKANNTLTLPESAFAVRTAHLVSVADPAGSVVAYHHPSPRSSLVSTPIAPAVAGIATTRTPSASATTVSSNTNSSFTFLSEIPTEAVEPVIELIPLAEAAEDTNLATPLPEAGKETSVAQWLPYAALLVLVLLAAGLLLWRKPRDEFDDYSY